MIISHSKKFIFLRGQKIAGGSIERSLLRYLSSEDLVYGPPFKKLLKYGIKPPDLNKIFSLLYLRSQIKSEIRIWAYNRFVKIYMGVSSPHLDAAQTRYLVGKRIWEKYFTFTFERNPWDRMISFYFWRTRRNSSPPTFKEFIDAIADGDEGWLKDNNLLGYSNLPYYTIDGGVAVDYIGRYENLDSDLQFICNRIDIPFDGWLPFGKSGMRPKEATQENMYDEESVQKIKRIFSREISLLGYKPNEAK